MSGQQKAYIMLDTFLARRFREDRENGNAARVEEAEAWFETEKAMGLPPERRKLTKRAVAQQYYSDHPEYGQIKY